MTSTDHGTPTITRVLEDGTIIEMLYDQAAGETRLAVGDPAGGWNVAKSVDTKDGERLVPYGAKNNLISNGCILLPSAVGEFTSKAELLERVRGFIRAYVDLPDPFEETAAHYVLLSWVYDRFSDLPYLRFRGDFGTGKTRALLTIGSICYKPFFASGASTVSPIFHIQDAFQGTLVLDEADFRYSEATAQLTKLLNNGSTKGMPVLRTMTNRNRELNPQAFRVYGPKLVAMREHYSDLALESRFLTCETSGRTPRPDVPAHLPEVFQVEALELRNALLAWRLRSRSSIGPDPSRLAHGVAARYRQTSWALLSLVDDDGKRDAIVSELAGEEARVLNERADTFEAAMLGAIMDSFEGTPGPHAPISDIASRFNQISAGDLGQPMTNKWVGSFVRRRLRLATLKTGGVYAIPTTERTKIYGLAERFGLRRAA
jgi:hypothetical protein